LLVLVGFVMNSSSREMAAMTVASSSHERNSRELELQRRRMDSAYEQMPNGRQPVDKDDELGDFSRDDVDNDFEPLEPTIYTLALTSIIRDCVKFVVGTGGPGVRAARLVSSTMLIGMTVFVQVFLVTATARLLVMPATHEIRGVYERYEKTLYPNATYLTISGHHRGIPGRRQDELFSNLSESDQDKVCQIALDHPNYLGSVLLIWTMTCILDLRKLFENAYRVLVSTPSVASMRYAVQRELDDTHRVDGLTCIVKVSIAVLVVLPRFFTTVLLLWLGCRWLLSTPDLAEILMNAMSLEFILIIPELVFHVSASKRSKRDTEHTFIKPLRATDGANCKHFFESFGWVIFSLLWVYAYMNYFQHALRDYQYDVADICEKNNGLTEWWQDMF